MGVALVLKNAKLFGISIYVAAGWGILGALWRLVDVIRVSGSVPPEAAALGVTGGAAIGLYLSLIFLLAVAGTCGFLAVKQIMKKS
jgi:hypothetical protein